MSAVIAGFLIIGASTSLAVAGLFVTRRFVPRTTLEACHEVGGYLLAVVGTLYAILLGMIVVESQAKLDQARAMTMTEANMLSNIAHLSQSFKPEIHLKIVDHLYHYAVDVQQQDWTAVFDGREKEATIPHYRQLWKEVIHYIPTQPNEQQCYATMLTNLEQLSDARRYRMVAARNQMSAVLWSVLIVGGVMIVFFTYFFFLEHLIAQVIMTSLVVLFISMNIFVIYINEDPYRPELNIKQSGFGGSFTPNWFRPNADQPQAQRTPDSTQEAQQTNDNSQERQAGSSK